MQPQPNPANIPGNIEKASGEQDYRSSLRSLVRALYLGHTPQFAFEASLRYAVERGLTRAWNEGAAEVGIYPDEFTPEESQRLHETLFSETSHISEFAAAIVGAQGQRRGLQRMLQRAEMWYLRYGAIRALAMSIFGQDRKLKWVLGSTEHCSSCLKLNGRVYRASVWNRYGIYPRNRMLACRGYRCRCELTPTTDRATPGRPPSIP